MLLVPGFVYSTQRRRRVVQGRLSPLFETASLVTVAVFTNAIALGFFALVHAIVKPHTPDVSRMLSDGSSYIYPRAGYVSAWAFGVLLVSCLVAYFAGARPGFLRRLGGSVTPAIVDTSIWYQVFGEVPETNRIFLGVDLDDDSYLSGFLDWYSTEEKDVADRDLVLATPITLIRNGDTEVVGFPRVIISARRIRRMYVSYIADQDADETENHVEPSGE